MSDFPIILMAGFGLSFGPTLWAHANGSDPFAASLLFTFAFLTGAGFARVWGRDD